ncbi:MAG: DUF3618 domain-containing protein [Sphingomicrobium sp.]|nr:DUF3618 domain-containing protein [Sphingomonadales bacterium]
MSAADVKIAAARGEADARRQQLLGTVEEIKLRLAPKTIAHDAWEGAKDKGSEVADNTITAVRQRPAVAAGVAAGVALLLARKPLISLVTGLFSDADRSEPHETEDEE